MTYCLLLWIRRTLLLRKEFASRELNSSLEGSIPLDKGGNLTMNLGGTFVLKVIHSPSILQIGMYVIL